MSSGSGLANTLAWLLYGCLSSWCLWTLKRHGARKSIRLILAVIFSAVDIAIPFTYHTEKDQVAVAFVLFLFPVVRPTKLVLYAVDAGPLSVCYTLRHFLIVSALPVIPVRCLPLKVQTRMPVFKVTRRTAVNLIAACAAILLGSVMLSISSFEQHHMPWQRLWHLLAFTGFIVLVMDGAAALASGTGAGPVVQPFNDFWMAASVADWWSFRWDTVVALTLRMSVYDPVAGRLQGRGQWVSALKCLAGLGTFALSSVIHEYALAAQGDVAEPGKLTAFFMCQPLLIFAEPWLHRAIRAVFLCFKSSGSALERASLRALTLVLLFGSMYYLWCPAYDLPKSDVNIRTSRAVLRLVGLCSLVPHCK
jgi:hypothetical protein